jgi:hypothetical protein
MTWLASVCSQSALILRNLLVGKKLMLCYQLVEEKAGLLGKVRLAMKTGIASQQARFAADSKKNLSKFREVLKEILGEEPSDL